jgi:hypothetical protein
LRAAYLDSSFFLGIAFSEGSAGSLERKLTRFDRLHSSNLLDAEVRSAFARKGLNEPEDALFESVIWTLPDRPLTPEFRRILAHGHQKGGRPLASRLRSVSLARSARDFVPDARFTPEAGRCKPRLCHLTLTVTPFGPFV